MWRKGLRRRFRTSASMSDKPRVVILSTFLTPFRSGAEACTEEIALRLCDRYDIMIVTARLMKELPKEELLPCRCVQGEEGKVPIHRIGCGFWFDKWLFPFLAPFVVRKLQPHIVHAVLETFAGLALHLCKFIAPSAKRILTLQTTNRNFLKGPIVRSPDTVTAISSVLVEQAGELGRSDVTLIPNGVSIAEIVQYCGAHQKISGRILFVGRLEQMKGIDTLLDAFAQLASTSVPHHLVHKDAHLHIVGDGSERENLERLVRNFGMTKRVTFLGYIPPPAVYAEFAQAEIFCGLSRSEALGNVFLEAQAAKCAVIGTTVGGIPDIVEDTVTGMLVPVDDDNAAAKVLRQLLDGAGQRERLVQAAYVNVQQYDWDKIAERYGEVYQQL